MLQPPISSRFGVLSGGPNASGRPMLATRPAVKFAARANPRLDMLDGRRHPHPATNRRQGGPALLGWMRFFYAAHFRPPP
jgi:hypothetical protein